VALSERALSLISILTSLPIELEMFLRFTKIEHIFSESFVFDFKYIYSVLPTCAIIGLCMTTREDLILATVVGEVGGGRGTVFPAPIGIGFERM
jgi:hypothetical protein